MRKHFLILMLLTLLPLAGWAVSDNVTFSASSGSATYTGAKQNLPTITKAGGNAVAPADLVDLKWYKVVGTTETPIAAEAGVFKFTTAGTYKVTFGVNGSDETYAATWVVNKRNLDVVADDFNLTDPTADGYETYHVLTYGDEAPAYTFHFDVTDLDGTVFDTDEKVAAELATITGEVGFNCSYVKGSDVANSPYTITPVVSGEGKLVSENYSFTPTTGNLVVVAKALSKDATKYTITVTDKEYNATAQVGGIAIKDLTFTGDDQTLTADDDYDVTYWVDEACTATAFVDGAGPVYYTKTELDAVVTAVDGLASDETAIGANYAAINAVMGTAYTAATTRAAATEYATFKTTVAALPAGTTNYLKSAAVSNHIDAGTYYMKVTGDGNYDDAVSIVVPFKITQKPLAVNTLNKAQNYTGTTQALTYDNTTVAFEGLVDADKLASGLPRAAAFADGVSMLVKTAKNVTNVEGTASDYEIIAYAQKGGKNVNNLTQIFKNYQVAYFNGGKLTINPVQLTFTVSDQEVNFGDETVLEPGGTYKPTTAEAASYFTLTGFVGSEKIKPNQNPTLVIAEEETVEGTGIYAITVDFSTLKYSESNGTTDVPTSNYVIAPAPTSTLTATLTINKGYISARPNAATSVYGDAEDELTVLVNASNAADKAKAETVLAKAITIDPVSKAADGYVAGNTYPGAGVYTMTLDLNKIKDEADYKYLSKYYNISKFTGEYTVTKRALTKIEIADQVLTKDDDAVTTLDEDKVTFTADKYDLTSVDKVVLKKEFNYSAVTTATETIDTEGVDHPRDIQIEFATGVTAFTNFSLPEGVENLATAVENKYIFGKLTVKAAIAGGIVLNPVKKAVWLAADNGERTAEEIAAIREAFGYTAIKAADQTKTDVKFGSFTMAPERWYTLVLPFNTTVAEVSQKLGYAVVNVLNKANDTEDVKFKLYMQEIAANEPFLVKVYKEINLADANGDGTENDPITFAGKTIVFAETPSVKDAANNEFIGTFKGYQIASDVNDEYYMATGDGDWYRHGYTRPSGAYLKVVAPQSARIFVEEPDGTTTAIELINGEAVPAAEGWYTLNGVKLQGVPTEKGVYINNGKKVVIK